MTKHIANILTGCRIVGSLFLLCVPAFSVAFYILYLFCGLSDMADGTIARKTKSVSEFGTRLDSVADGVFAAVCFAKILPFMHFPAWLWTWIAVIAIVKTGNAAWGLLRNKKPVAQHTVWNKVTGFLLFLLPLTFPFAEPTYGSAVVCIPATLSAIHEACHIRRGKEVF